MEWNKEEWVEQEFIPEVLKGSIGPFFWDAFSNNLLRTSMAHDLFHKAHIDDSKGGWLTPDSSECWWNTRITLIKIVQYIVQNAKNIGESRRCIFQFTMNVVTFTKNMIGLTILAQWEIIEKRWWEALLFIETEKCFLGIDTRTFVTRILWQAE